MTRWLPGGPPDPLTPELKEAFAKEAKRKRIRQYAIAALPAVINRANVNEAEVIARTAFKIAEEMEYQEHVRNRQ